MPIYCASIEDDPIIDGHTLFKGVKHLNDDSFPKLKVNQISLPKKDILYYIKGEEKVESKETAINQASPKKIDDLENSKSKDSVTENNIFKKKSKPKRKFVRNY